MRSPLSRRNLALALLVLFIAGSASGWGNAGAYAQQRSGHLNELQSCEEGLQELQQKNWVCAAQEKESLLNRLSELNKASVAAVVCATEPPGSESAEEMEARGAAEMQCRAEWLAAVQEQISRLKSNCKNGCASDDDCEDGDCVDGACVAYPPCASDADCIARYGDGYYCLESECVMEGECVVDSDCEPVYGLGYVCLNYECWQSVPGAGQQGKQAGSLEREQVRERFQKNGLAPQKPLVPELDEETKEKIKSWTGLNPDDFAAGSGSGKKAYVVISDTLSPNKLEMVWVYKKMQYMVTLMNYLGYDVRLLYREDDEELFKAMSDPDAGAMAYYGHESSPGVGGMEADDLELTLAVKRKEWYMSQGMSESEALKKANSESSMNLDFFYNHSCHSADEGFEQLANLAVRPGGAYYGQEGYLWATSSPSTEYLGAYD